MNRYKNRHGLPWLLQRTGAEHVLTSWHPGVRRPDVWVWWCATADCGCLACQLERGSRG